MADEVTQLLTEIRDLQREQIAEYRRVVEQSLELQRLSVARQAKMLRMYVGALCVCAVLLIYLFGFVLRR